MVCFLQWHLNGAYADKRGCLEESLQLSHKLGSGWGLNNKRKIAKFFFDRRKKDKSNIDKKILA